MSIVSSLVGLVQYIGSIMCPRRHQEPSFICPVIEVNQCMDDETNTSLSMSLGSDQSLKTESCHSPECVSSKDMEMDDSCWTEIAAVSVSPIDPFHISM